MRTRKTINPLAKSNRQLIFGCKFKYIFLNNKKKSAFFQKNIMNNI